SRGGSQAPRAAVPLPRLVAAGGPAEQHGDPPGAVVDHRVAIARRRSGRGLLRPCGAVPLPRLVASSGSAEPHADPARAVVGHRVVSARRGTPGGSARPLAAVMLPGVGERLLTVVAAEEDGHTARAIVSHRVRTQ